MAAAVVWTMMHAKWTLKPMALICVVSKCTSGDKDEFSVDYGTSFY